MGPKDKISYLDINSWFAPGYCPHFRKPETLLDGEDDREHGSHGSATVSRTLYSHATGLWSISLISSFTGIAPRVASKAT